MSSLNMHIYKTTFKVLPSYRTHVRCNQKQQQPSSPGSQGYPSLIQSISITTRSPKNTKWKIQHNIPLSSSLVKPFFTAKGRLTSPLMTFKSMGSLWSLDPLNKNEMVVVKKSCVLGSPSSGFTSLMQSNGTVVTMWSSGWANPLTSLCCS